jgi:hypothetical protein
MASMISSARAKGQKLILFIPQGGHEPWKTNGQFDLGKWEAGVNAFATTTIKNAVAEAVADGTVIGSSLIDEPENKDWGGNITKPMLDEMAAYVKARFPTLPVGVNHGGAGSYTWRTNESYKVVDYVISQYNYNATKGDVAAYKRNVLARAAAEGWTPAFSMNILSGGVPDNDGTYDCAGPGQAGLGTRGTTCRMTADQVKTWGQALVGSGCFVTMWKFDDTFFARGDNQTAFRAVADSAARLPRRGCMRS